MRNTFDSAAEEPVLEANEIQGNILVGFRKEYQCLILLTIVDRRAFKVWLKGIKPFLTSSATLLESDTQSCLSKIRLNIAFSYRALRSLVPDAASFSSVAFREDVSKRSHHLGDPTDP